MSSRSFFLCALLVALFTLHEAHATVPDRVMFTARLADDGNAVEGPVQIRLDLYRAPTGGSAVWTESHDATATEGLVAIAMGDNTPLDATVLGDSLFLEITVGSQVLSPRLPIHSVPFALVARAAEKLGDLGRDDVQRRVTATCPEGSSIRAIDASGNVACETDDAGNFTFTGGLVESGGTVTTDPAVLQRRIANACPAGSTIRSIDANGVATCDPDENTTYTAGTGIAISASNVITPDFNVVQRRVAACANGSSIRSINADGSVVCEADTTGPTYSQTCPAGQFVSALSSTGAVTCSPIAPVTLSATSTSGTESTSAGTTRTFCALTSVRGINVDDPRCTLFQSGGQWFLRANSSTTIGSMMVCEARCF